MIKVPASPGNLADKKKPVILSDSKQRHTGRLKFFDEKKNYGFIIMDEDETDIFVHFEDLNLANLSIEDLKLKKLKKPLRVSFCCLSYIGKHNKSRKAVDIKVIEEG